VTSASILTVLCFTIERYLAICFPIISQKVLGGLNRALKMIMIVWFLSFLLAVPYTFTAGNKQIVIVQSIKTKEIAFFFRSQELLLVLKVKFEI